MVVFAVIMTLGNIAVDSESGVISRITFLLFMYIIFGIMFLIPAITINQSAKAVIKNNGRKTTKSWIVTLLLNLFLGTFGAHRFYVGKIGTGIAYFFTVGGFGIGYIVDLILNVLGKFTDKDGNLIKYKPDVQREKTINTVNSNSVGINRITNPPNQLCKECNESDVSQFTEITISGEEGKIQSIPQRNIELLKRKTTISPGITLTINSSISKETNDSRIPSWEGDCGDVHSKVLQKVKSILQEETIYPYMQKKR